MLENVYEGKNARKCIYEGLNVRPKVYLSKEHFCEMYLTCVSSKLCKFISVTFCIVQHQDTSQGTFNGSTKTKVDLIISLLTVLSYQMFMCVLFQVLIDNCKILTCQVYRLKKLLGDRD